MLNKQVQLTKEGLKALKDELEFLVNIKRPKVVERLANARAQGDLSENSDYANAKEDLEFLDGRISEIEEVLKVATIARSNGSEIAVGTKVTLGLNGQKHVYDIVGEWEADPVNKKISPESPLGKALFGKKVGDVAEVEAPAGKLQYKILAIE